MPVARRPPPVRDARARGRAGGLVVVDDPPQARGVPPRVRRLRPREGRPVHAGARGATPGRRRDRPQPREDRGGDRQRARATLEVQRDRDRSTPTCGRSSGGGPVDEPLAPVRPRSRRDRRLAGDVEGPEAPRVPVRRPHDLLRVHAGHGDGRTTTSRRASATPRSPAAAPDRRSSAARRSPACGAMLSPRWQLTCSHPDARARPAPRRSAQLIVRCAMRHFAEHGYQGARIEDMATELQIAKGSSLPALRVEGRPVPRGLPPGGRGAPPLARRPRRGPGPRFLRGRAALARTDRAPREGGLGPVPRDADRHVRHRPVAPARDQPVHGERGPLRHPRVHRVGTAARRGARRPRPRDRRVDGGLAHVLAAGRDRHRGARPGAVPPVGAPARAPADAPGALRGLCSRARSAPRPRRA